MIKARNIDGPVVIVCKDIVYAFPFGIAYLAGYLRQKGKNVQVLFRPENPRYFRAFAQRIKELNPLVVGFGSLYPDLYPVKEIIGILNHLGREFPVVVGGQMVSPMPEFAVKITEADLGVIGEGEIIFNNLVDALREGTDLLNIKGLMINDAGVMKFTGYGEFIEDLSKLPSIPYDLFPMEKWLYIGKFYTIFPQPLWRYTDRVIAVHGGRGCPYSCNFCYHSNKARYRDIKQMFDEADEMLRRYDANMLYFGDDLVLGSPARAQEIVEAMTRLNRPVEYSVSCRFDILSRIDDKLLREMNRTGCRIMGLGIESGSQRILDIMHKKITVEQITNGLHRLKEAGIFPSVSIMVGQLDETRDDINKSMDLMLNAVRDNKYIQFAFTVTTPFPGSELYDIALKKGLLSDGYDFFERFNPNKQFGDVTVNFTALSDNEIVSSKERLEKAFLKERGRMQGNGVMLVELLRKMFGYVDVKLRNTLFFNVKQKSPVGFIFRIYSFIYDYIQVISDKLRLRLLGL